MKGLAALPKVTELKQAYRELEGRELLPEARVALLAQWARLDPRLAELLTGYLLRRWTDLRVLRLLQALAKQPWPRAILVPLRFVELTVDGAMAQAALRGVIDAIDSAFSFKTNEMYFIPLQRMNRVILAETLSFQTAPYLRSGYTGSASLLAKGSFPLRASATILDAIARDRILKEMAGLLTKGKWISVDDYIERCRGLISRRQAQRDLASSPYFTASGFTRNQRYRRSTSAN